MFPYSTSTTQTPLNSQPTQSSTASPFQPAFMYPYTYGHDQGPYVYPPHFPHLTTPSASTSTPNLLSPQDLNQPVTPGRLFQPLPWYPAQLPPEQLSEMDSPTDNSRKRGQCNQGSSNCGNRRRRTAPSATSNENSTAIPETESHINPTATAEVCGVGPILAHTQRPPSPSKNPALNSRIFRAMAKKTGRGSGQVASDVWYNVRPCESRKQPSTPLPPYKMDKKCPNIDDGQYLACRFCIGIGKWHAWKNTNGQSDGIRDHLQKEHWDLYRETVLKEKLKGFEKISTHPRNHNHNTAPQREPFSLETFHEKVVRWIAVDDQSINVVDCPELRDMLLYIGHDLRDADIPHRTKLTELVLKQYEKHWQNITEEMKASLGHISYTSDMWSNGILKGFMAITAHYMVKDLSGHVVMRSRLITFRQVHGSHDGANMAKSFMSVLEELGISDRIGQITLDNASNNNTMMASLESEFMLRGIPFHRDGNRIRCFPHIINIAVKTALSFVTSLPPLQEGETDDDGISADEICTWVDDNPVNTEDYRKSLESDLISRVRYIVAQCRASGNRREDFRKAVLAMRNEIQKKIVERGHSSNDDDDELLQRVVVLLHDVDTRWSSTFLMVDRFLELYPAIERFILNDPKLSDTILFKLASAEKTPTLSIILPLYEGLIEMLGLMKTTLPNLSHIIDVSLRKLREYVDKARGTRIYTLAMAINPTTKLEWISENWPQYDAAQARQWLKSSMLKARRTIPATAGHVAVGRCPVSSVVSTAVRAQGAGLLTMQRMRNALARSASYSSINLSSSSQDPTNPETPSDEDCVNEELRQWLDAGILADIELNDFDIVRFWDLNQHKFPCLYRIALDVLPVQASAVPCKRAFSSSKETDSLRRSHLSSHMMEVLQVLKHIYHSDRLNFSSSWIARVNDEGRGTMLDIEPSKLRSMVASGQILELIQLIESSNTTS